MKANELRIGNYIYSDLYINTPILIESISSYTNDIFNSNTGEIPLHSLIPIPLTSELLLKSGFHKYRIDKYGNEIFRIKFNNGYIVLTKNSNIYFDYERHHVIIKSYNQLQNLIFELTGEELTIK